MNKFEYVQGLDIPFQIVSYTSSKSVKLYVKKGYIKVLYYLVILSRPP